MVLEIVSETNRYAISELRKSGKFSWKNVTDTEFWVFLGLCMGMALHPRKGGVRAYWETKSDGVSMGPNFGRFMLRSRFENIRRYLHFSDNEKKPAGDSPAQGRLYKLGIKCYKKIQ